MHVNKWKKPILKSYIVYDSNYVTFWKRQNFGDNKKITDCQGGGDRKLTDMHREFLGHWKYSAWFYNDGYMSYSHIL